MRYFPNQRHRGLEEKRRIQADDAERKRNRRKQNLIRRKRWKDQTGHEHEERRETQSMADEADRSWRRPGHEDVHECQQTETDGDGKKTRSRCIGAGILWENNDFCAAADAKVIIANLESSEDPAIGIAGECQYPRTVTHLSIEMQGCGRAAARCSNGELDRGQRYAIGREAVTHEPDLSLHKECVLKLQLEHGRLATKPRQIRKGDRDGAVRRV